MYNVLIAEDEPISLRGLHSMIMRIRPNYCVTDACNGEIATKLLREEEYHIFITDIKMPGLDGLTVIEQACKNKIYPLCVILSGYDDFEFTHRAIHLSVFDYLLKPVDDDCLLKMIEQAEAKLDERTSKLACNWFVKDCKQFIIANISNTELSLTMLADRYHYSANYLSTWFKNNIGENFNKYLTKIRMEEAAAHLESGKKVYEASTLVGYADSKYFEKVFKIYYSYTPDVYRRMRRSQK